MHYKRQSRMHTGYTNNYQQSTPLIPIHRHCLYTHNMVIQHEEHNVRPMHYKRQSRMHTGYTNNNQLSTPLIPHWQTLPLHTQHGYPTQTQCKTNALQTPKLNEYCMYAFFSFLFFFLLFVMHLLDTLTTINTFDTMCVPLKHCRIHYHLWQHWEYISPPERLPLFIFSRIYFHWGIDTTCVPLKYCRIHHHLWLH